MKIFVSEKEINFKKILNNVGLPSDTKVITHTIHFMSDKPFGEERTATILACTTTNSEVKSLEQHDKDILCDFAKELYYFINYSYISPYNPITGMLAYESRNVLTKEKIYDKIYELLKERGVER